MKQCPQCSRTYSDGSLNFCLQDGTALVSMFDVDATHGRDIDAPSSSKTLVSPVQSIQPTPAKSSSKWPWVAGLLGVLFIVLLVVAVGGVLLYPKIREWASSEPRPSPTATPTASPTATVTPSRTSSPIPSPKPSLVATPTATPLTAPSPVVNTGGTPGLYPEGSLRLLMKRDLSGKNCFALKIMRNEIFARRGYIFKTPDMTAYFSAQPWYKPRYRDVTSMLTATETANVQQIKDHESSLYCN